MVGVTSALRGMVFRGEVTEPIAAAALLRLVNSVIERVDRSDLYATATRIASSLGWAKTYDAEYVALARLLDAPLVTLDERLMRGASAYARVIQPAGLGLV